MTQEFPYPAKILSDAAKSFQELGSQNLNAVNSYMPPMAQALAKFGLEMMRFSAKRFVECSELPEKLGKCQSTPEMFRKQMAFFDGMRQQYTEEWFRLVEILGDFSWQNVRPNGAASIDTIPGWNAMTAWMQPGAPRAPEAPPKGEEKQPAAQAAQPMTSSTPRVAA
jgi:hypothetical protein